MQRCPAPPVSRRRTPRSRRWFRSCRPAAARQRPVGRIGRPEDVSDAIALLVGNGFVSGETIVCDGGVRWAA
jgi:NAD(P)-dependent dehydrogenase (short-subunit alcohol dehydrogenase family)